MEWQLANGKVSWIEFCQSVQFQIADPIAQFPQY